MSETRNKNMFRQAWLAFIQIIVPEKTDREPSKTSTLEGLTDEEKAKISEKNMKILQESLEKLAEKKAEKTPVVKTVKVDNATALEKANTNQNLEQDEKQNIK